MCRPNNAPKSVGKGQARRRIGVKTTPTMGFCVGNGLISGRCEGRSQALVKDPLEDPLVVFLNIALSCVTYCDVSCSSYLSFILITTF